MSGRSGNSKARNQDSGVTTQIVRQRGPASARYKPLNLNRDVRCPQPAAGGFIEGNARFSEMPDLLGWPVDDGWRVVIGPIPATDMTLQ